MPQSKRAKVVHLSQVDKKSREHRERIFDSLRDSIPSYQYIIALSLSNARNSHLQAFRAELRSSDRKDNNDSGRNSDSESTRLFLCKATLMARALGRSAEEAATPGLEELSPHVRGGSTGLLLTNRSPEAIKELLAAQCPVDFARAGTVAPRSFTIPPGIVYSTGGQVEPANDVPMGHTMDPELRRLGVPTRLVRGKVMLGGDENGEGSEGYAICKEGQTLDSRQTRLLKLFSVCMAEFGVEVKAYWSAASGEVTVCTEDEKRDSQEQVAEDGGEDE